MFHPIATAPRDGELVKLYELGGTVEIGRWCAEIADWTGPNGEPLRIVPTHWVAGVDDRSHVCATGRTRTSLIIGAGAVGLGIVLVPIAVDFFSVVQERQTKEPFQQSSTGAESREASTSGSRLGSIAEADRGAHGAMQPKPEIEPQANRAT